MVEYAGARAGDDFALIAWIDRLECSNLLRRLGGDPAPAEKLLECAIEIAQRLPAKGIPIAELAALSTGDSHALDSGRPLASLIMELAADSEIEDRRGIWARLG